MKSIKFKKKLRFRKETIADLHSKQMDAVHGGIKVIGYPITYSKCLTGCPSNDSAPQACCAYC